MTASKKKKAVLIMALVAVFITGLLLGFLLGKNADIFQELFTKEAYYRTSCSLYIQRDADVISSSIVSSDLDLDNWTFQGISSLLEKCYPEIKQLYPDVKFDLTLEKIENTTMCCITVTGEDPKQITEICNMAAELLPEKVAATIDGVSCKVIDYATIPSAPIE